VAVLAAAPFHMRPLDLLAMEAEELGFWLERVKWWSEQAAKQQRRR
jgi:hypothetical protein